MIRCGGFFFSADGAKAKAAAESAKRITTLGARLQTIEGGSVGIGGGHLVALAYAGTGQPLFHGWPGEGRQSGECSSLSMAKAGLQATRDYCGTRPLYVSASGKWVASDHRFCPKDPMELLVPGAVLSVPTGRIAVDRAKATKFEGSFEEAAVKLAGLIQASVKARADGLRRVAVAFSGGLDSSILAQCAKARAEVVACSVSVEGSVDSRSARDAAGVLGLEFVGAGTDAKSLRRELLGLDLPFKPSLMDRSLWCIYSIAARLAYESGAEAVMLGQLADELFGGYSKYEVALRNEGEVKAEEMMVGDVAACGMRGFTRDEAACRRWSEPRFPFAERRLAAFGESLPVSFKIREGVRKAVLREAALLLGVPKEIAYKPKKAAQYSSGVLKLLS